MNTTTLSLASLLLIVPTFSLAQRPPESNPTTISSPVVIEAGERGYVTGSYWGEDDIKIQTWCERRYTEGSRGIVDSDTPQKRTFSNESDWPNRNSGTRETQISFRYDLAAIPQRSEIQCYYKNIDDRPEKWTKRYNTCSSAENRNDRVLHRRYFQCASNDVADFQYRIFIGK